MPTPGKNFPGQRGFPTPNSTPDSSVRRIFVVPKSAEWLGLIMGAAEVLREEWRWYQWGELTPAEAADAFNTIIIDAFTNLCPAELPGGSRIIRVGYHGTLEEAQDDGSWAAPSGDYEIPPVTPREGGTEQDQNCLAAANAANVLQQLYENLSDSWNDTLNTAEAQTAFILGAGALIAAPIGLAAEAILAIVGLVFEVAYATLEFITADLWTEDFTSNLRCILLECATNDAGVVTFDLDCVNNKLAAQVNLFDLTESQLRLFGQIQWIFSMIGVDGLNLAGATTAITDADCSACDECSFVALSTQDYGTIENTTVNDWLATATFLEGFGYGVNIINADEGQTFIITAIAVVAGSGDPPAAFAYRDMDTMDIVTVDTLEELIGHCTNFAATSEEVGLASYQLTLTACLC